MTQAIMPVWQDNGQKRTRFLDNLNHADVSRNRARLWATKRVRQM